MTIIYGLPGLYQNWLSASLDVNAKFVHQGNNFHTLHSAIPWVSKHQADYALEHDVINCYVSPSNLPWYLYNFFEKTDDIGINVDHWCSDIQRLGTDTIAYQGMLDHWQQSYNIANYQDQDYIKNSAVEYFYLFFIQPSPWRDLLEYQHPGSVNIEYGDFTSISMLRNKLSAMVHFDDDHFVQMYARLNASNYRYLSLPNQFKNKLAQLPFYTSFTVIDLAWLGALFYQIDHNRLDWFNPDTRHQTILQRYTELRCDQYNNNVNIQDL